LHLGSERLGEAVALAEPQMLDLPAQLGEGLVALLELEPEALRFLLESKPGVVRRPAAPRPARLGRPWPFPHRKESPARPPTAISKSPGRTPGRSSTTIS